MSAGEAIAVLTFFAGTGLFLTAIWLYGHHARKRERERRELKRSVERAEQR